MLIAPAIFMHLASACAPQVAPGTMASIASTESGFNTLAIHDNTTGRNYAPSSSRSAIVIARRLRAVGDSIDLGLMQINSLNLSKLSLTIPTAFKACPALGAAAKLLVMDYKQPANQRMEQQALQQALSRYNTGNGIRGFQNGYVQRVVATARRVVPEINPAAPIVGPKGTSPSSVPRWRAFGSREVDHGEVSTSQPPAPAWNVFPRSTGPARLARHRAVTITARRLSPAVADQHQPGISHEDISKPSG
ncbi:MAG: lytic transglycosylase domain-containing protein [Acidiphilium sp.]|nr:lytic transglycosylase domain-containing protein [Acidiphilium sp.]